jgi:hypothetical protein
MAIKSFIETASGDANHGMGVKYGVTRHNNKLNKL